MNIRWVGLICLLSLPPASQAQFQSVPAIAAKGSSAPGPSTENHALAGRSQEPFVIERYLTAARYENDGTGVRDLTVRIRVGSEAGAQQLRELVFPYNSANDQMEVRYLRVRKADGTVVHAGADAAKDVAAAVVRDAPAYADYKEKRIAVPALVPGDTLEYEIVARVTTPPAPGEFWFQHNFLRGARALDEQLEINVPQNRIVNVKSPDFAYKKTSGNGRTIYRWERTTPARPPDENSSRKTAPGNAKPPDVQITTFAGWDDVAHWYAKLEHGRTDPTPEIRAKTEELVRGQSQTLAKIERLYDYVSTKIRYVSLPLGQGRPQPHSAAEVFSNRYGDAKDKHTLLAAMLRAAGIEADAVLIPYGRKLDAALPNPSQLDHVVTAVSLGNQVVWMDSTAEVAPFGLLPAPLRGKSALLVRSDGTGKIVETPADPAFRSAQSVEIEGRVNDLGKLTATLRYVLRGDTELALRLAFRHTPASQWNELGQNMMTYDGIRGEAISVTPSDPLDTRHPFRVTIEYSEANFLDWSAKKSRVALPVLTIGLPDTSEGSSIPIEIGSPLHVVVKSTLKFPADFTAQPPVGLAVSRDYAEYKSHYNFSLHTLTAERSLDFKMREIPSSRAGDYLAFAQAVTTDQSQSLVVENTKPGGPAIPDSAKPDELFEAGLVALNAGRTRSAIPLLERAVELDPRHPQGWNDLGLSYLRAGMFAEAASAFRKQMEINPSDEHANDYLGLALERQRKYDEAAAAFRKQLGIDALDPAAHAALGEIFLGQLDYAQAVPELEKAAVLSPDNAELQISLARAYLNTGERQKAIAAFQKGADLSPTPAVWNEIAYNLAENKFDLDKAQQYAQSAVSAAAASLQNFDLLHLTPADLRTVANLGAYWDTLGWVYVQSGDPEKLQKARRYINAAWLLNLDGEAGDHLAQIYERLGQKERATHAYTLALAAPHSDPDARARLTLLLGGNAQIDDLVNQARSEFQALHSFSLKGLPQDNVAADFLILLSPEGTDGGSTKVESVKFMSGNESLRPFAERLKSFNYGAMFPDASPVKLVRRGTLSCSAKTGDCTFTLIPASDVQASN
jgi:tetratricopeptide (TPR) repeat protein/transglutaminase-like putative cysteine protease